MGVYNIRNLPPSVGEAVKTGGWQALQKELIRPIQENPEFRNYIIMRHIQKQKKKNSGLGGAVKGAIKTVGKVAGNIAGSSFGLVKGVVSGDIKGALGNAANLATFGTVDTTGKGRGILNAAKYTGAGMVASSSMLPYTEVKKKGLLTQLRQGKGGIGGGSYTEAVKNSLGGSAGSMGK